MKIVRLVLLLCLVGVPVACSADSVTGPKAGPAGSSPLFNGTSQPDSTNSTNRDGGGLFGSGT